jgi:S1-C subfamily serine protease
MILSRRVNTFSFILTVALTLSGISYSQPAAAQGKLVPIKIKPLSDTYAEIDSLRLQFDIVQDGKGADGKAVKGNMFAKIEVNNAKEQRRTTLGGSLLISQMEGNFPAKTQMSVLNFGSDAYVLLEADTTTCLKTEDASFTKQIDDLQGTFDEAINELVIAMSQDDKTPIASLVGEEIVNGIDVQHYVVDSATTGGKPILQGLNKDGSQFKQAKIDVWTATEGDYLVKLALNGTGKSNLTGDFVDGKVTFSVAYSDINKTVNLTLPKSCQNAVAAPATATEASTSDAEPIGSYKDVKQATVRLVARGTFWAPGADEAISEEWSGSGFIIDPSGLAMTNNHVVVATDSLQAYVGGEVIPRNVKVIARNECADVALIKISGRNFPFLAWNENEVEAGLDVYAAGFPLGDPEFTLTRGIVSKARANGYTAISGIEYRIEHDATINPGNSGGPLVTAEGRVVGVNAAQNKEARQSFATPASIVLEGLEGMKEGKDVTAIGILPRALLTQFANGVWAESVQEGSLAGEAGVKPGDIITSLGGEAVIGSDGEETMESFCRILREKAGENMSIEVTRLSTSESLAGELGGEALSVSGQIENNSGNNSNNNTEEEMVNIEIINNSTEPVAKIYIVSPDSDDWGDNVLEGDPIEPDGRLSLQVRKGIFDFKPANDADESLGALYSLTLEEGSEIEVTGIAGLPAGAKKAFEDKFDKLQKNVWTPTKEDDTETTISDGEYCMAVNKSGWSIWDITKTKYTKNFSAEVSCNVDPAGGLCAMGFGADNDNNYWMSLTPEAQTITVFEKRNGNWLEKPIIDTTKSFAIKPSGTNFMGIDRVNGKIFVYANGRLLAQANAAKFNTPRILVGGGTHADGDSARACLDNFTVWNVR